MKTIGTLLILVMVGLFLNSATYTLSEVEQAIITQFGEPVGEPVTEPGLHFRVPFTQTVHIFDKRWLEWDGDAEEIPTREKTYIWVDTFARWRIKDPLKFYISVKDEMGAQSRLDDIIDSETRNVVASHDLLEVVRSTNRSFELSDESVLEQGGGTGPTADVLKVAMGRAKLADLIREKAQKAMPDYGIELVDVQFQRVNYTESVKAKVFERMVSERKRIAERYRSEGEGKLAEILGKKDRDMKEIQSDAYRKAEEIRGKADAEATTIYASSHNLDPKLYRLLKSLQSYRKSVDENTWIIMSTDSDYFEPMVSMTGGK